MVITQWWLPQEFPSLSSLTLLVENLLVIEAVMFYSLHWTSNGTSSISRRIRAWWSGRGCQGRGVPQWEETALLTAVRSYTTCTKFCLCYSWWFYCWIPCKAMATLLPVHSDMYSTQYVLQQIEDLGLLVRVAFLGDNLLPTLHYLESSSDAVSAGRKSYLVLHYTPSRVTSLFNLTSVKFEACEENWGLPVERGEFKDIREEGGFAVNVGATDCLYNYNRFAKVKMSEARHGNYSQVNLALVMSIYLHSSDLVHYVRVGYVWIVLTATYRLWHQQVLVH